MKTRPSLLFLASLVALCAGCSPAPDDGDAGIDAGSASTDGGPRDAGPSIDGATTPDVPLALDASLVANGVVCEDGSECTSGHCVDGVCCDTACDGVCQACIATLTDGDDGTCTAVLTTDPQDECEAAECLTGACGASGCELQPSIFVCRDAAGDCDAPESCTGTDAACPADTFLDTSTVCRSSVGVCDVEEVCTGTDPSCPADAFEMPSAPLCAPYRCSGAGVSCETSCSISADCAAGNACVVGACVPAYRMFVTSADFLPNFGGVAGADASCASAAAAAGIEGVYRAWIGTTADPVSSRLVHSPVRYYRIDGVTTRFIANDWADLVDGITVAIASDEYGMAQRNAYVWTGSNDDGSATGVDCSGWTMAAGLGTSGNASAAAFSTYYGNLSCTRNHHLYCVEQPAAD